MIVGEDMRRIEQNLARVMGRIAVAARRAGRDPADVTVVAVSKTFSPETVVEARRLGISVFGENKVQEAWRKIPQVREALGEETISWHMVGHLQRNKVKQAVKLFDLVHSMDSLRLVRELESRCAALEKHMPVLLEINVSGEASKYGLPLDERKQLEAVIESVLAAPHLELQGLMTIAPIASDPEEVRPYFRRLRHLRDELARQFPAADWRHLSMGMTDDFEIAVEEGATLVRIGRAIFGPRHS